MKNNSGPKTEFAHFVHKGPIHLTFWLYIVAKRFKNLLTIFFELINFLIFKVSHLETMESPLNNIRCRKEILFDPHPSDFLLFWLAAQQRVGKLQDIKREHGRQNHGLDRIHLIFLNSLHHLVKFKESLLKFLVGHTLKLRYTLHFVC